VKIVPYQLPLAPPPDELPPPELLLNDEDEDEDEKNELSVSSLSRGMTRLVVSLRPQCWQVSVMVSRPLRHLVGERTRETVLLSVTKPQAGHLEYDEKNAPYRSVVTCGQVGQVQEVPGQQGDSAPQVFPVGLQDPPRSRVCQLGQDVGAALIVRGNLGQRQLQAQQLSSFAEGNQFRGCWYVGLILMMCEECCWQKISWLSGEYMSNLMTGGVLFAPHTEYLTQR
jgi:hypothetical protein